MFDSALRRRAETLIPSSGGGRHIPGLEISLRSLFFLEAKCENDVDLDLTVAGMTLQQPVPSEFKHRANHRSLYKRALMTSWPSMTPILRGSLDYFGDALSEFCEKQFATT